MIDDTTNTGANDKPVPDVPPETQPPEAPEDEGADLHTLDEVTPDADEETIGTEPKPETENEETRNVVR